MQSKLLAATDENMATVNDFIHSFLPEHCPFKVLNQIDLAVEEIYINIAHYAYKPNVGSVEITCDTHNGDSEYTILIIFKDSGKPFNPLERQDPDITLSAEERNIGGLGIYLTKQFMDEVKYEYKDGFNILSIKKSF